MTARHRRCQYRTCHALPAVLAGALMLAACSGTSERAATATHPVPDYAAMVKVSDASEPIECVTYARNHSGIELRGDAWRWWSAARGHYDRGHRPARGAVLVLKRQRDSLGHLAVVRHIVNARLILADHANWLNEGRIYRNTPIADVSARGDWSRVRIWYPPGATWGTHVYAAYGFIYGNGQLARSDDAR